MKLCYFEDTDTLYIELKIQTLQNQKIWMKTRFWTWISKAILLLSPWSKRTDLQNLTVSGIAA